jgi:CBS-domain-containing membrane protein
MLVQEVISAPAVTVGPSTSVKEALRLLDERSVTAMPVVDSRGRIVGVVSEAALIRDAVRIDVRTRETPHEETFDHPRRVEDVMSLFLLTVDAEADLTEAVDLMTTSAAKSLPVVDGGRVVGVVSRSDVIHVLARSDQQIRAEVDDLLRTAGTDWEVEVLDGVVDVSGPIDDAQRRVAEAVAGSVTGVIAVRVS